MPEHPSGQERFSQVVRVVHALLAATLRRRRRRCCSSRSSSTFSKDSSPASRARNAAPAALPSFEPRRGRNFLPALATLVAPEISPSASRASSPVVLIGVEGRLAFIAPRFALPQFSVRGLAGRTALAEQALVPRSAQARPRPAQTHAHRFLPAPFPSRLVLLRSILPVRSPIQTSLDGHTCRPR